MRLKKALKVALRYQKTKDAFVYVIKAKSTILRCHKRSKNLVFCDFYGQRNRKVLTLDDLDSKQWEVANSADVDAVKQSFLLPSKFTKETKK